MTKTTPILVSFLSFVVITSAGFYLWLKQMNTQSFLAEKNAPAIPDIAPIVSKKIPIIFVHGYNQSSQFWKDINIIQELRNEDYISMANFLWKNNKALNTEHTEEISDGQSAVYTLSMPQFGTLDIRQSGKLLNLATGHVTTRHRCATVRLIGFSMGGVVIREYITSHAKHRASQVITVSSPHVGSEHAWLAQLYKEQENRLAQAKEIPVSGLRSYAEKESKKLTHEHILKALDALSNKLQIPINSMAARMLMPPTGDNYLSQLNKRPHPTDISYHSVITEENLLTYHFHEVKQDWEKMKKKQFKNTNLTAASVDVLRHSIGKIGELSDAIEKNHFRGDGIVSCHSQNMNHIEAFQNDTNLNSGVSQIETSHLTTYIRAEILRLVRKQ